MIQEERHMKKFDYRHRVMIAGHRGDPAYYPENTMVSFRSAVDKGADMIETDVHMTRDGVLVLMHDHTVDRTTDGTGLVSELTAAEIAALRVSGEPVPTLREFLEYVASTDVLINIEMKDYFDGSNAAFVDEALGKIYAMVEEFGLLDRCVFNSFDAYGLIFLAERHDCRLHGFYPYSIMRNVTRDITGDLYCACIFDNDNQPLYDYLADHGVERWLGAGVVEKEQFANGVARGANLFTTNDPGKAIAILEELGVR